MSTDLIDLRAARKTDCDALAAIHYEAWLSAYRGVLDGIELQKMISRRGAGWWQGALARGVDIMLLTIADMPAGYATYGPCRLKSTDCQGEIYELYLRPEYQGLGFGRMLFDEVRCKLRGLGLSGLAIQVLSDNQSACGFYQAAGGQLSAKSWYGSAGQKIELSIYIWPKVCARQ